MIKRPLAMIGAVFFLSVLTFVEFGFEKAPYIILTLLVAVFFLCIKRKLITVLPLIIATVVCSCLCFHSANNNFTYVSKTFDGVKAKVSGKILDYSADKSGNARIVIQTDKINKDKIKTKIFFYTDDKADFDFYKKVSFNAELTGVESMTGDIYRCYKSESIPLTADVKNSITVSGYENKPFMYYIKSFRQRLTSEIYNYIDDDYNGLIIAMLLGDKVYLDDNLKNSFSICGVSHIFAVSGVHTYIWGSFIFGFFSLFLSKRKSSIFSIIFISLFMAITGFSSSVVRAGIMMIIVFIARLTNNISDSFNNLGIAALFIALFEPLMLYNIGTVLSFASVFSIITLNNYIFNNVNNYISSRLKHKYSKIILPVISTVFSTISASLIMFPLSVFYSMKFSFLSIIANLFISDLSAFIMIFGGLGAVASTVGFLKSPGNLLLFVSGYLSKFCRNLVNKLAYHSGLYVSVTNFATVLFVLSIIAILYIYLFNTKHYGTRLRLLSLSMTAAFLFSFFTGMLYSRNTVNISVINVGNGMCTALSYDSHAVLIGCGGSSFAYENISTHLNRYNIKVIDFIYVPSKEKYNNCLCKLCDEFDVNYIGTNSDEIDANCDNITVSDYFEIKVFDGISKINIYSDIKYNYCFLNVKDKDFLISLYGKLDYDILPQYYRSFDYYITSYLPVPNLDLRCVKNYIVSSKKCDTVPENVKKYYITNNGSYSKTIFLPGED